MFRNGSTNVRAESQLKSENIVKKPALFCRVKRLGNGYDEYKGLFVCSLNIGSLLKHFDEIKVFLDEYKPHILGLNETRLNDDVEDDDLFIEGYSIVRRDRNRNGGGVAIYISDDIPYNTRPDFDTGIESVSIQVNIPFIKPIIFTCVYRPPGSKVTLFENIEALFSILDQDTLNF